jgi:tRNA pseudouridine32 synthase/23S rRNA pseudouridine746 synthase
LENNTPNKLTYFPDSAVKGIDIPVCFTFPFNYVPHPLTIIAAKELQRYLETQTDINHNFGLTKGELGPAIGKMFGVLIVKDKNGRLGYLSAFSGKLAGSNHHPEFVPPVFDMLAEDGFFIKGIKAIDAIGLQVKKIGSDDHYKSLKQDLERSTALSVQEITDLKEQLKNNKSTRKKLREEQKQSLSEDDHRHLEADLVKQSLYDKHLLDVLSNKWAEAVREKRSAIEKFETRIEALKNQRRERSAALQQQLFEQYEFLNKDGHRKSLQSIFNDSGLGAPPAAAGECATPKLLQYAFLNGYTPLAMAEFWWGAAPKSEIRQHKQFYPACTEKCKPILKHMLEGIAVEQDPHYKNTEL